MMRFHKSTSVALSALASVKGVFAAQANGNGSVDLSWYAPLASSINNLDTVINGTGVHGFIFNSSVLPQGVPYGTYDWCNMPHVRPSEYPRVNDSFELQYVELIHRHHKRTPYAANTFPVESYPWYCDDEGLFYYGAPLPTQGANHTAPTYWDVYTSPSNPLVPEGFNGTCQFPQITRGGLDDSWQHGLDLFSVYHTLLDFIPATYDPNLVAYRVTNNVITSQVASMVISGMYPSRDNTTTPLLIQPDSIDSLEPAYTCTSATNTYSNITSTSIPSPWQQHLQDSAPLTNTLDAISNVPASASDWHVSWDHYFDNLSSRLCHSKPLPCNKYTSSINSSSVCVTEEEANEVFRLGEWEYDYQYRSAGPAALDAAVGSYGIWVAELAQHFRDVVATGGSAEDGESGIKYRHNVAHDGSLSRLLAILQVDRMVWPGMGAEVVFELYRSKGDVDAYFVRVLWGGQVLTSSSPTLGVMDMVPLSRVLGYSDGLVGVGASKIVGLCGGS